jgi:hypothetical protein
VVRDRLAATAAKARNDDPVPTKLKIKKAPAIAFIGRATAKPNTTAE